MLAAEKWYEYQKCYKKYGLDMKPAAPAEKSAVKRTACHLLSPKDKARLLALIFLMGFLCIALIITAAYSAQIKFNTNSILAQADRVQGEIENINVAIKSVNNITVIEDRAIGELGMVYPSSEQILYINSNSNEISDFALTLKQLAFKY